MRKDIIRLSGKCEWCDQNIYFSEIHDSAFCLTCNQWTEERCCDPMCIYCDARPKYPVEPEDDIV